MANQRSNDGEGSRFGRTTPDGIETKKELTRQKNAKMAEERRLEKVANEQAKKEQKDCKKKRREEDAIKQEKYNQTHFENQQRLFAAGITQLHAQIPHNTPGSSRNGSPERW